MINACARARGESEERGRERGNEANAEYREYFVSMMHRAECKGKERDRPRAEQKRWEKKKTTFLLR